MFLYQKLNSSAPNYISTNRGCENGAYFNYIVDHYDSFPDIAIFVHGSTPSFPYRALNSNLIPVIRFFCAAKPEEHQKHWLDMIPCIHPNATYININIGQDICRRTSNW